MFNIGFGEMFLLGIIALIFIGPEQLPQLARTLGRLLNEWKRATSDLQSTFTNSFTEDINRHLQNGLQNPPPQNSYEQNPAAPASTQAQNVATPEAPAAPTSTEKKENNS